MALADYFWYVSRSRFLNVTQWAASTAYTTGQTVRPSSTWRVWVCLIGGTSGGSEPSWSTSFRATQADNTVTWLECSGHPIFNGDSVNAPSWAEGKLSFGGYTSPTSMIICNNARTHAFATTNGNTAFGSSEPTWNTTTGATTTDAGITWRCLGPLSTWGAWANPMSTLGMAFNSIYWANAKAGCTVFVASDHYYSSASSLSINYQNSSLSTPGFLLSVDADGSVPPTPADLQVGAQEETTGSATAQGISGGWFHVYGVRFTNSGSGLSYIQDRGGGIREKCIFETTNGSKTGTTWNIDQASLNFVECTFRFGVTGDGLGSLGNHQRWDRCVFCDTGAVPTNLFGAANNFVGQIVNCDLSMFGSGKTLVNPSVTMVSQIVFEKCILHGSQTDIANADIGSDFGSYVDFINCDTVSNNDNYRYKRITGGGTLTVDDVCVRTGGATDGTTPYSWKIVTVSDASILRCFRAPPIYVWNDLIDMPITLTIYGYWSGAAVPKNTDIEMEAFYFGSKTSTLGATISNTAQPVMDAMNPEADATNHDADTSTWGTGGTTKFKMSLTLTPRRAGPIRVDIRCLTPSKTIYIDPKIVIT